MLKTYSAAALVLGCATFSQLAQAQGAAKLAAPDAGTRPTIVRLEAGQQRSLREAPQLLAEQLQLRGTDHLQSIRTEQDELGFTHEKYQQYYKGIKVEHATYSVHARQGKVETLSGDFARIPQELNTVPSISSQEALRRALAFVGARQYRWQLAGEEGFRPTPELVLVENYRPAAGQVAGERVLAWKFNIYATEPLSRAYYYVDAHTGRIVLQDNIIKHVEKAPASAKAITATAATATFATAYSGTRQLADETATGGYHLREYTRGNGIETYNCKKGNSYTAAVDFVDGDNNWTAAEYNNAAYDNVAGDAHFGAQSTYDYWKAVHSRNSYDNAGAKIKSYVHFDDTPGDGVGFENAYWDGTEMTYGDGASTFKPLTALDVCGHEIGHAVCENTANLTYSGESGAMNEGFSDCWGASVEKYTCDQLGLTKSTWDIGEDIMKQGGALRSMSNPNLYGQPAYYKGTNWASTSNPTQSNDEGGVHTNSGILNYWYYLISVGKTGTNEKSQSFAVTGIGLTDAAHLLFRAESVYLTASSNYAALRTATIQASTDLFGATATQTQAVTNAWYAVGIGAAYSGGGTTPPTGTTYCTSKGSSVAYEYVAQVALGSINRTSTADGGYYDGTALNTSVAQGSSQTITYKAGFVSSAYTENFKVYVDWNQDGDFVDSGETVASSATSSTAAQTATFTVPATATAGKTRLRVVMSDNTATTSCGSYSYGETEDYSLTVTTGTSCGVPTGLSASALSSSGATLAWTAVSSASSYNVQYRVSGTSTWTSTSSASASKALSGLAASTTYEFQVQTVCASGSSAFSSSATFATSAATTTAYCASKGSSVAYEYIDLVNLGSINRSSGADGGYYNGTATSTSVAAGSSQTIKFSAGFVSSAYTEYWAVYIDYNQDGDFADAGETVVAGSSSSSGTLSSTFTVPATAKTGTTRLRVVMSDNSGTTSCGSYSYGETEDYSLTISGGSLTLAARPAHLSIYPNPTTDRLTLSLPGGAQPVSVLVLDVRGAQVPAARYEGDGQLNVSTLAAGFYLLRVSDGTQTYTERFTKQ